MELVRASRTEEEEAFWRRLVLPEEDHLRMGKPWTGGYRWFRSANVVPLEQWRAQRQRTQPSKEGAPNATRSPASARLHEENP